MYIEVSVILFYVNLCVFTLMCSSLHRVYLKKENVYISLNKLLTVLLICLFTFIMGFRDSSIGIDTIAYARSYVRIGASNSFWNAVDASTFSGMAYIFICRILYFFSENAQFQIFATSLIVNLGLYFFVIHTSDDSVFSLYLWQVLLFFSFSMNGNRQTMAMVFAMNAMLFLHEKKNYTGIVFFLLAVGIHPSVLLMLFVPIGYWISHFFKNKKYIFAISCIAGIVFHFLLDFGAKVLIRIVPNYVKYISGKATSNLFVNSGRGRGIILYIFLFFLLLYWLVFDIKEIDDENNIIDDLVPSMIFGVVVGILNSKNTIISRMILYFLVFYILLIPTLIKRAGRNRKILLKVSSVLVLSVYYLISLAENKNGVIPFLYFWQ